MKLAVLITLLAAASTLASAAPPSADESIIRGLEYSWNQAELHHDVHAIKALLADTFVRVDNRGRLLTKAEYMNEIGSISNESDQIVNEDLLIHVYGDTAIAVSTYHVVGKHKKTTFRERGRFTDTWVRIDGKWQCVANQETLVQ